MPAKNSIKIYSPDSFYHIYNRGVDKRDIFLDQQDLSVFLSYLKTYLSPKDSATLNEIVKSPSSSFKEKDKAIKELQLKNYSNQIELVCYALMQNHFHLLVRQKDPFINRFMNSLGTRYGMYFNRKYHRTGILFQDVYKAVIVETDEQLLHLSRYIHLNPIKLLAGPSADRHKMPLPSSLPEYLNERQTTWIKSGYILDYFSKTSANNSYRSFLELSIDEEIVIPLAIDYESGDV